MVKFRVWSGTSKSYLNLSHNNTIALDHNGNTIRYQDHDSWDHAQAIRRIYAADEVMEFWTGLKDKNGKEIYEGDIVSTIYEESPIGYIEYCSIFGGYRIRCGIKSLPIVTLRIKDNIGQPLSLVNEIIGNIHENPELLEPSTCDANLG